jgi:outer membrane protein TolC
MSLGAGRAMAIGLAALAWLGAAPLRAESPTSWRDLLPVVDDGLGTRLSEKDAVARALANSRQVEALENDVAVAARRRESAGVLKNPTLRVRDISSEYLRDRFDELSVGLRWQPPRLGDLRESEAEADLDVTEARVEAARARLEAAARVRHTYAELILIEQLVRIRTERLELETRRLDLVERMKNLGQRSIVYFAKARLRHGESRSELSRLVQKRNETRRDLVRRVGLALDELPVVSAEALPERLAALDDLQRVGFRSRPEGDLVHQRKELAAAQYTAERFKRLPWPTFVEVDYHLDYAGQGADWVELSFGISLPLFDWNTGAIRATELEVARKETRSAALAERLETEIQDRYAAWRDALLDWQLSTADAEALVASAEAIIAGATAHGTLPSDEVLELQLAIQDAREIVCNKRFELAEALTELMLAVGVVDADALVLGATGP